MFNIKEHAHTFGAASDQVNAVISFIQDRQRRPSAAWPRINRKATSNSYTITGPLRASARATTKNNTLSPDNLGPSFFILSSKKNHLHTTQSREATEPKWLRDLSCVVIRGNPGIPPLNTQGRHSFRSEVTASNEWWSHGRFDKDKAKVTSPRGRD